MLECSNLSTKVDLREKIIYPNRETLSVVNIMNIIIETFEINKRIRLFNFDGFEIKEDSDLRFYIESFGTDTKNNAGVIYFTRISEVFENKHIIRIFRLKKKLGEVSIIYI